MSSPLKVGVVVRVEPNMSYSIIISTYGKRYLYNIDFLSVRIRVSGLKRPANGSVGILILVFPTKFNEKKFWI